MLSDLHLLEFFLNGLEKNSGKIPLARAWKYNLHHHTHKLKPAEKLSCNPLVKNAVSHFQNLHVLTEKRLTCVRSCIRHTRFPVYSDTVRDMHIYTYTQI